MPLLGSHLSIAGGLPLAVDRAVANGCEALPRKDGGVTVHWYDMRYAERPTDPNDHRRHTSPFGVWVQLSPSGRIVAQGLGPG